MIKAVCKQQQSKHTQYAHTELRKLKTMNTRLTTADDIKPLQSVLNQTELFPSEMLPEMIADFLSSDGSGDIWLTCELDGTPIGFCYATPEALTEGTWNMLAIAVLPSSQTHGAGSALTNHLEKLLQQRGHRILIADTSGSDAFKTARNFYRKNAFTQEARIRDFWADGDDKIIFWKKLS